MRKLPSTAARCRMAIAVDVLPGAVRGARPPTTSDRPPAIRTPENIEAAAWAYVWREHLVREVPSITLTSTCDGSRLRQPRRGVNVQRKRGYGFDCRCRPAVPNKRFEPEPSPSGTASQGSGHPDAIDDGTVVGVIAVAVSGPDVRNGGCPRTAAQNTGPAAVLRLFRFGAVSRRALVIISVAVCNPLPDVP